MDVLASAATISAEIAKIEKVQEIAVELRDLAVNFLEQKMQLHRELHVSRDSLLEMLVLEQISIWSSKNAVLERKKVMLQALLREM